MPILTEFQRLSEAAITELLDFRGCELEGRELIGNGELFIHARIKDHDIELWIYEDETEVRSGRRRRNFESAVFKSETERIAAFIKSIEEDL
jgi:hypothetical protein